MVDTGKKLVIVTGPESTGKTSIAKHLSIQFNGEYVPEYARSYISTLKRKYTYNDILSIAEKQKNDIDALLLSDRNTKWFIDTHLIITKIWFKWYSNQMPEWMDSSIKQTKNCFYLLCAPDIEWEADDVRENGGENRIKLFEAYKQELLDYKLSFRIVSGENDERFRNAVKFVEEYFG